MQKTYFAALAVLMVVTLAASPAAAQTGGGVVERKVTFSVVHKNTSRVVCPADGRSYTLRGSLVAPAAELRRRRRAVTLLVHGAMLAGDKLWRMRPGGDRSFDFALAMARRGHAVASVELVGYGDTVDAGGPNGMLVCQGSEADVIHQVVDRLRNGSYGSDAGSAPSFARVGLAGFSFGAQYTQIAAYSFPNIDALLLMGWAEPFLPTPDGVGFINGSNFTCFSGGEPKNGRGGPGGYVERPGRVAVKVQWAQPEPRAERAWIRGLERDPCGLQTSGPLRAAADVTGLPDIEVPVLVAFGERDELIGWLGARVLYERLSGSRDRRLMLFPGAGHSFFLERRRPTWIKQIAAWLQEHDL